MEQARDAAKNLASERGYFAGPRRTFMSQRSEYYATLSSSKLLELANDMQSLTPDAKASLIVELDKRGLTSVEVSNYGRELRQWDAEREAEKRHSRYSTRSFNGFGTALYGRREFARDGSYVTTKWGVFLWLPVCPIRSMRVKPVGGGPRAGALAIFSTTYDVYCVSKPVLVQVVCVYAFIAGLVVLIANVDNINRYLHWSGYVAFIAYCGLPYLLRSAARRAGGVG